MKELKIQWHPGFVVAMDLELRESRDDLWFEKEYNLNTKPLDEELMGDENMCEALMEIMEPQLLKREKEGKQEGLKEGLKKATQLAVEVLRDIGQEDAEIRSILVTKYGLTGEEADEYMGKKV